MKHIFAGCLLLSIVFLSACEKSLVNDDGNGSNGNNSTSSVLSDDTKTNALPISQAQEAEAGTQIWVKGYLTGSTERSMSNACYAPEFKGTSAVVLGKQVIDAEHYMYLSSDVFPICLTDASKGIRESYNLVSNPDKWKSFVYVRGTRTTYLGLPGLNKVQEIIIDPNHNPDTDEAITLGDSDGDEAGNGSDGEDNPPSGGEEGTEYEIGGDNDDEDAQSHKTYSVAEAKEVKDYTTITVRGYIVAATSTDIRKYLYFQEPFDARSAIVIADKPSDPSKAPQEQFDLENFTDLFPVCLTENAKFQKVLNLKDNPTNHNKLIQFTGKKQDYLWTKGMKDVTDYKLIDQE